MSKQFLPEAFNVSFWIVHYKQRKSHNTEMQKAMYLISFCEK